MIVTEEGAGDPSAAIEVVAGTAQDPYPEFAPAG